MLGLRWSLIAMHMRDLDKIPVNAALNYDIINIQIVTVTKINDTVTICKFIIHLIIITD